MMETRYHYTECGLENVYLRNGFRYLDTPHGRGVAINDLDGLHRAIGRFLIYDKKRLNGRELRFLRHELGLSQAKLGVLLDVDEQTVARWEKGKTRRMSSAAEKMVRVLYEEQIGGDEKVSDLLRMLAELDELRDEDMSFEDTEEGWRRAEAA